MKVLIRSEETPLTRKPVSARQPQACRILAALTLGSDVGLCCLVFAQKAVQK